MIYCLPQVSSERPFGYRSPSQPSSSSHDVPPSAVRYKLSPPMLIKPASFNRHSSEEMTCRNGVFPEALNPLDSTASKISSRFKPLREEPTTLKIVSRSPVCDPLPLRLSRARGVVVWIDWGSERESLISASRRERTRSSSCPSAIFFLAFEIWAFRRRIVSECISISPSPGMGLGLVKPITKPKSRGFPCEA
ncbi:MAG: hypothetical protein GHCLOJNM_03719 [bacterium]|nr:hypothetical protein [bacterium]